LAGWGEKTRLKPLGDFQNRGKISQRHKIKAPVFLRRFSKSSKKSDFFQKSDFWRS
jgi:hypothetical protein